MPNLTKRLISDQVLFRLESGWPDAASSVQKEDVWKAAEQKINAKFKFEQFSTNLNSGETIPDGLNVGYYEDVAVVRFGDGKSKATLPVLPITLPKNAGIQLVLPVVNETDSGDKQYGKPMIPLVTGQYEMLQTDGLLNDLIGRWGYTPNGSILYFTKDLTLFGITKVDMKLVVFDISSATESTILPIPSDYEEQLINELVDQFSGVKAETGIVNKNTTAGNNP